MPLYEACFFNKLLFIINIKDNKVMTAINKPKAYLGNGKYIFISYSHKDADRVYDFINVLQRKCNVWFDEGIHFGREWDEDIVSKIDHCSLFIYVITPNSLESKNCKDEIAYAKQNGIPFINVLLEEMELPSIFSFRYGRFQMCKYYEYRHKEEVLEELFRRNEEIRLTVKDAEEEVKKPIEVVQETPKNVNQNKGFSLFNLEKEITIFPLYDSEKEETISREEYFNDDGEMMYRLVLLPSESMNLPTQKVEVFELELLNNSSTRIAFFSKDNGYDARYSHNVLNRGYNCICINIKTDKDLPYLFSKVHTVKIKTKIYSIFNDCLDVNFEVIMNGIKDVSHNPDTKIIPELVTFNIHHCHYKVG